MENNFKIRNSNVRRSAIWGMALSAIAIILGIADGQTWVTEVGVVAFIVCFGLWIFMKQRTRKLRISGYKIISKIDYISLNIRPATKAVSKWVFSLVCSGNHPATNQKLEFQSEELSGGKPIVDFQGDKSIDVYVDKNDSRNYYVDISKIKPDNNYVRFADNPPFDYYRSYDGQNFESVKKENSLAI